MNSLTSIPKLVSWLLVLVFLTGCSALSGNAQDDPEIQPTLTPTADALGYQAVPSPACLVADWPGTQSDKMQGDLIAWQPGGTGLAYLAPSLSSTWYTGVLSLASGDKFVNRVPLTSNITASGDLTWSPDGMRLAFVAVRVDEGMQTVMVINQDGSGLTDLFPLDSARTDARTSQKSILKWLTSDQVRVLTSCGEDCQQAIDFNVRDGSSLPDPTTQRKNADSVFNRTGTKSLDGLEPITTVIEYDAEKYPRVFNAPNWSPDTSQVMYLDRRGLLWVLNPKTKKQFILDIGLRLVNETKWTENGRSVAVRAEDRIYVYEIPCTSN